MTQFTQVASEEGEVVAGGNEVTKRVHPRSHDVHRHFRSLVTELLTVGQRMDALKIAVRAQATGAVSWATADLRLVLALVGARLDCLEALMDDDTAHQLVHADVLAACAQLGDLWASNLALPHTVAQQLSAVIEKARALRGGAHR